MPAEFATATASASVENEPYAITPAASAAAMTARTPSARNSGVAPAVPRRPADGRSDRRRRRLPARAGPPSPRAPRSSGRSPRRGGRASAGPRRRPCPVETTAIRRPTTWRRLTVRLRSATFWWISLLANRVSARVAGRDEDLGLRGADSQRPTEDVLGERERRLGILGARRAAPTVRVASLTTCRLPPGRCGSARPARHARRARSATARPCRSSACRASRSSGRRRPRRTSARTRR